MPTLCLSVDFKTIVIQPRLLVCLRRVIWGAEMSATEVNVVEKKKLYDACVQATMLD